MRILVAHTYYQQPGGEDRVFEAETALLRNSGHTVLNYCQHNLQTSDFGPVELAARTIWNPATYSEMRALLRHERPDVCHFHNTFPIMSPSVFYAARAEGVPVVATLHNYRLLCPAGTLLRDDAICEECVPPHVPWQAVRYGCYRKNRAASAVVALMLTSHQVGKTWKRAVDIWIALTEFAREKFIEGGLDPDRVAVKPNFLAPDPGGSDQRKDYALFVGRLSPEKGIETLLKSWLQLQIPMPLRIAGGGPLQNRIIEASREDRRIQFLGPLTHARTIQEMQAARLLVFPSIWYEGLPLTIIEAFATGLPVIASNVGAMRTLISAGRTGLLFTPGDSCDLVHKLNWCWQHAHELVTMGQFARQTYLELYTAPRNYQHLMQIYERAMHRRAAQSRDQVNRAGHNTVIDDITADHSARGAGAAGSGVESRECVALDNNSVQASRRVAEQSDTLW